MKGPVRNEAGTSQEASKDLGSQVLCTDEHQETQKPRQGGEDFKEAWSRPSVEALSTSERARRHPNISRAMS